MARRVFFSFHYQPDNWRASQVRNIGAIEGNRAVSDNDWEAITHGGDKAIEKWIEDQLHGRSCTVVLIGSQTAGRKWITYEVVRSWNLGKGVVGIHVHHLLDRNGRQSYQGANPFDHLTINGQVASSVLRTYDPPYFDSKDAYNYISSNIGTWVDEAVSIRNQH